MARQAKPKQEDGPIQAYWVGGACEIRAEKVEEGVYLVGKDEAVQSDNWKPVHPTEETD
jgi:hypothetical protein